METESQNITCIFKWQHTNSPMVTEPYGYSDAWYLGNYLIGALEVDDYDEDGERFITYEINHELSNEDIRLFFWDLEGAKQAVEYLILTGVHVAGSELVFNTSNDNCKVNGLSYSDDNIETFADLRAYVQKKIRRWIAGLDS